MRHFTPDEFNCKCGECVRGYDDMQEELITRLDDARERAGVPFVITSAVRCEKHNRAVGGVDSSAHVDGWAVDIAASGSRKRWHVVSALIEAGFTRIGIADTFVHADCDPSKSDRVIWTY